MRTITRAISFTTFVVAWLAPAPTFAAKIQLANGDELHGEILEQSDEGISFAHPQLGTLQLGAEQLLAFNPKRPPRSVGVAGALEAGRPNLTDQAETAEPAPEKDGPASDQEGSKEDGDQEGSRKDGEHEEETGEKADPWFQPGSGLLGTPLLRGWTNSFGVGLSGSQGGFEDTKLSLLFNSETENEKRKWLIDGHYFLNVTPAQKNSSGDDITSKNQAKLLIRRDWKKLDWMPIKKVFAFAQTRYQFDEFQPWEHRIAVHAGPGYRLLDDTKLGFLGNFDVRLRGGFGASYSFGETDRAQPEAMAGFTFEWRIASWSRISSDNDFFFDMNNGDNFRTVQDFKWDFDLGEPGGLGIRFGFLYNFDTESVGKVNDLTYLSSLTYRF